MRLLLTGATGQVGSAVLQKCLEHPAITSIVVFSRRALPEAVTTSSKLTVYLVADFAIWTPDMLAAAAGADAMIWAIGAPNADETVNYDYALAFQTAFADSLTFQKSKRESPFRFILVSAKFASQKQDNALYFKNSNRRLKGRAELKALEIADAHRDVWRAYIMRPGGVVARDSMALGVVAAVMGSGMAIRDNELGAFAVELAVRGHEQPQRLFENSQRARELLRAAR